MTGRLAGSNADSNDVDGVTSLRSPGVALPAASNLTISFAYYAFMQSGKALGHNGAVPPYLAAWLGDLVFGGVGVIMMFRAQRR